MQKTSQNFMEQQHVGKRCVFHRKAHCSAQMFSRNQQSGGFLIDYSWTYLKVVLHVGVMLRMTLSCIDRGQVAHTHMPRSSMSVIFYCQWAVMLLG